MVSSNISTAFIIRHGERLDHVDKLWTPDPSIGIWDPPITRKGFQQAQKTGHALVDMIHNKQSTILIYSSPFQRCIDTALSIAKGLYPQHHNNIVLRLDLGLCEWMSDRFFDDISCTAHQFLSRQQEKLARLQAYSYHQQADIGDELTSWPPHLRMDYAYHNPDFVDFGYPERYTDMIQRFEKTRVSCLESAASSGDEVVIVFVTHAVGVNALLDGFRNTVTIPLKSNYCSISSVRRTMFRPATHSDQSSDDDVDYHFISSTHHPTSKQPQWSIELTMFDSHLS
ncbi:MAG: histidine phosphatase superfamily [Benjaminiella poitrasii]|nr:MAG: histidine phosphatase superfamily [Benjaminiella poitrasii]